MLQICPKCHRAYNVNEKCPHCSMREERKLFRTNEKIIHGSWWLDGSFEDFKLCTEGLNNACNVVTKTKRIDTRFINRELKEKKVSKFKLFLDSFQNPTIVIEEIPSCYYHGREIIIRKPYIGVVFDEDAEEEYISLDTFRSTASNAINITTGDHKTKLRPSLFSKDCTYEFMYYLLKEKKYKFFKLVCDPRLVIDDYRFSWTSIYITDADMSY
jgi:hypothetical protein